MRNYLKKCWQCIKQSAPSWTQLKKQLSNNTPQQIAWGSVVGVLIGLTPTVGIQMYVVTIIWLAIQFFRKGNFSLPVAVAWVWVSNPVTIPFLYAAYYFVGCFVLGDSLGKEEILPSTTDTEIASAHILTDVPLWVETFIAQMVELGWATLIGSLIIAVPLAILSYPATLYGLHVIHYKSKARS